MIITKIQGGIGNQLFQYATGRALSIYLKTDLGLDISFFKSHKYSNVYRLDRFNLPFTIKNENDFINLKNAMNIPPIYSILRKFNIIIKPYYTRYHLIETDVLKLYKKSQSQYKDFYIEGWFGNEEYFKNYRDIIIKDLNLNQFLNIGIIKICEEIKNINSISVHIRRGDYMTNGYFKNLSVEYYRKSMKLLMQKIKDPVFYFFSDDIAWTKENFSMFPNTKFIENDSVPDSAYSNSSDIIDLALMSSCKHHIIANSTYSWWGAWLNTNPKKIIIAPSKWYNDPLAQKNYEKGSFIPNTWGKIYAE